MCSNILVIFSNAVTCFVQWRRSYLSRPLKLLLLSSGHLVCSVIMALLPWDRLICLANKDLLPYSHLVGFLLHFISLSYLLHHNSNYTKYLALEWDWSIQKCLTDGRDTQIIKYTKEPTKKKVWATSQGKNQQDSDFRDVRSVN